jgi:hypothetical protein
MLHSPSNFAFLQTPVLDTLRVIWSVKEQSGKLESFPCISKFEITA